MKKRNLSLLILGIILSLSLVVPFFYSKPIFLGHYKGDIIGPGGLDGCKYFLITDDDKFELVGYDDGAKKNVIVYYFKISSGFSICMVGPRIRVLFTITI
ncbi:MAG: hypothetical protein ACC656_03040 [Candidatus Heimdallarchaeota archaeon]